MSLLPTLTFNQLANDHGPGKCVPLAEVEKKLHEVEEGYMQDIEILEDDIQELMKKFEQALEDKLEEQRQTQAYLDEERDRNQQLEDFCATANDVIGVMKDRAQEAENKLKLSRQKLLRLRLAVAPRCFRADRGSRPARDLQLALKS